MWVYSSLSLSLHIHKIKLKMVFQKECVYGCSMYANVCLYFSPENMWEFSLSLEHLKINGFAESVCCLVTCWTGVCPSLLTGLSSDTRVTAKAAPRGGRQASMWRTAWHMKYCFQFRILQKAPCQFQHPGQSFKETRSDGTGFWHFRLWSCV